MQFTAIANQNWKTANHCFHSGMLAEQHMVSSTGGGRTLIIDVCPKVLQCVEQYSLDFSRLVCVTTDGAPAMIGQKKGAALLLVRHGEAAGHTQPIHKMNCIIHQEALCAKSANLVDVMGVVVKVVNSILSRSLHHRQFQALVDEVNVQYGDLLYFCEVRWLSRGAMLSHVCGLQKEIATFCRQKNLSHADQLFDPRWLARLALLTDITTHLNAINVKLRGKDILVTNMHAHYHRLRGKAAIVVGAIG